jgi:hypothetical protein
MIGHRIDWRPSELTWIKRRKKWERRALHAAFVKKFRRHRDVPLGTFKSLCKRSGWLTGRRAGRPPGYSLTYSKVELAFLKRRRKLPRAQIHAEFVAAFPGHAVSFAALKQIIDRNGWHNGRDARFKKGIVPANKGKKMPYNANSARTQFKKGTLGGRAAEIVKPIGAERFSKDGYLERKIHNGLPMQSRWRAVHILNWEKLNGPLPPNHCLKCLDGDKLNTAPSNWDLISRAVLARLNKSRNRYETAPAELKPTIMAIAKLRDRLGEKRRSVR